mmetsp:Transcript_2298/g.5142  ORF Transcript_2298/g.5142 Transcript_2298/m.5142 type:complete len:236 (+) Transcript_2298:148-855(+)
MIRMRRCCGRSPRRVTLLSQLPSARPSPERGTPFGRFIFGFRWLWIIPSRRLCCFSCWRWCSSVPLSRVLLVGGDDLPRAPIGMAMAATVLGTGYMNWRVQVQKRLASVGGLRRDGQIVGAPTLTSGRRARVRTHCIAVLGSRATVEVGRRAAAMVGRRGGKTCSGCGGRPFGLVAGHQARLIRLCSVVSSLLRMSVGLARSKWMGGGRGWACGLLVLAIETARSCSGCGGQPFG